MSLEGPERTAGFNMGFASAIARKPKPTEVTLVARIPAGLPPPSFVSPGPLTSPLSGPVRKKESSRGSFKTVKRAGPHIANDVEIIVKLVHDDPLEDRSIEVLKHRAGFKPSVREYSSSDWNSSGDDKVEEEPKVILKRSKSLLSMSSAINPGSLDDMGRWQRSCTSSSTEGEPQKKKKKKKKKLSKIKKKKKKKSKRKLKTRKKRKRVRSPSQSSPSSESSEPVVKRKKKKKKKSKKKKKKKSKKKKKKKKLKVSSSSDSSDQGISKVKDLGVDESVALSEDSDYYFNMEKAKTYRRQQVALEGFENAHKNFKRNNYFKPEENIYLEPGSSGGIIRVTNFKCNNDTAKAFHFLLTSMMRFGKVVDVDVRLNRRGRLKGFGYVHFEERQSCDRANNFFQEEGNELVFQNRVLEVSVFNGVRGDHAYFCPKVQISEGGERVYL